MDKYPFMICKNEFEIRVTYTWKSLPRLFQQFHTRLAIQIRSYVKKFPQCVQLSKDNMNVLLSFCPDHIFVCET